MNNPSASSDDSDFDPTYDLLVITSGNDVYINIDRVRRDIDCLAESGRIALREHLLRMKETDFVIAGYDDKNRPISVLVQQIGNLLLNRHLYPIVEEYWKRIEEEISNFNSENNKQVNRGIALANTGIVQIVQGKVIEGLFNIYRAYEDDRVCLQHLPEVIIDPEKDMASSIWYTQFEERQIASLFSDIVSKFSHVFHTTISKEDLSAFVSRLNSDRKLLFYMTLYRFSFAFSLNNQLTTIISRSEILRSLAELALWFEDELKRNDTSLSRETLHSILDKKVGQLNQTKGQYTDAKSLNELSTKIANALKALTSLEMENARIMVCLRNFASHNLEVQDHNFFQSCDEVFARMLSFIIYSRNNEWI